MGTIRRGLGLALLVGAAAAACAREPKVGEPAPPFELRLVDGTRVASADLRGQVVVLNFWATWCGPCKRELPLLDTYYALQKAHGLSAYAVTTQDSLPVGQLKKLFAAMAMPSARGFKGGYGPIGGAVPSNYVIDRTGVVRYAKAGAFDLDTLNTVLVPLLNEPAPAALAAAR